MSGRAKAAGALHGAAILGLLAAVALVDQGSLGGPFIYDDRLWITWNPSIRHLWPLWDLLATSPGNPVHGRPILSLSLALNRAIGGENPWGYHVANVVIHALCALTLFGVVRRTLAFLPVTCPTERGRTIAGFLVALLWAVHPLLTESVTYVIQRAESLMGLFYLLTLYCFIRGLGSARAGLWNLAAVLACLLGMGTKEPMVTAPALLLLYDRTFAAGTFVGALRRRRGLYLALALTWLPLAGLGAGLRNPGVGYTMGYTWWTYGITEGWVVMHYLLLAFWPRPLVFDYGADVVPSLGATLPWARGLGAVALGAACACLGRRSAAGFAVVAFLVLLAPSSSIVPVASEPMAESRMYLPLAALAALVVGVGWSLQGRRSLPVFLGAALALGTATWFRNRDYRTEAAIWADTVRGRPANARARVALGSALAQEDRPAEAAEQFAAALRIDPGDFEARLNYGLALFHLGRIGDALSQYRSLVPPTPDSADLHFDLGLALDASGRPDEAIAQYRRALEIDPLNVRARNNLGALLFRAGRFGEALADYRQAARLEPDSALTHYNLGMALAQAGSLEEAIGEYRWALRINPDNADAHNNLGGALARAGRPSAAIAEFEQALRIRPDYARARSNLEQLRTARGGP